MLGLVLHFFNSLRGLGVSGMEGWKVDITDDVAEFGGVVVSFKDKAFSVERVNSERVVVERKEVDGQFVGVVLMSYFLRGELLEPKKAEAV